MGMISDGRMAPIIDKELPIEEAVTGVKCWKIAKCSARW